MQLTDILLLNVVLGNLGTMLLCFRRIVTFVKARPAQMIFITSSKMHDLISARKFTF